MGGLGSGRQRSRLGLDECRSLEVGELCDQGRWRRQPRGEVLWHSRHGGDARARLTYVITALPPTCARCTTRPCASVSTTTP